MTPGVSGSGRALPARSTEAIIDSTATRIPADLWQRAAAAPHRLLVLDYDGTLAPFRVDPLQALPEPGALEALRALCGRERTTLAVASGRPLAELVRFLPDLPIAMAGEHGWEQRDARGAIVQHALDAATERALVAAREAAGEPGSGSHLEPKRTALTLHTRGVPRPQAAQVEARCAALWRELLAGAPLRLVPVNGGLELRAAGRDKGTFVRQLLEALPPGTLAVYLGDDATDEDAFREVGGRGHGIRVGTEARPSLATGWIASCALVVEFLRTWRARVEAPGHLREARS